MDKNILDLFYISINTIEMTIRMVNFLAANRIQTIGDLVQLSGADLMKLTYTPEDSDQKVRFSKKDLAELQSILKTYDLQPGVVVDAEIRAKVDSEIKKLENEYARLQTKSKKLQVRLQEIRAKNEPPRVPDPGVATLMEAIFNPTSLGSAISTHVEVTNCLPELQSRIEHIKGKIADLTKKIRREEKI